MSCRLNQSVEVPVFRAEPALHSVALVGAWLAPVWALQTQVTEQGHSPLRYSCFFQACQG